MGRAKIANGAGFDHSFANHGQESPPFANAVFTKSFRSRPFGRNLYGHGHAFAEKQFVLEPVRAARAWSQVVHAAEELAISITEA